jgi:hypothetical protein
MIRNLKTLGDDEKQLMIHKEALQLAIKNDEAIAAARAGFQQGKPIELPPEDTMTLSEKIADEDKQADQARNHLAELFKAPEVLKIMSMLSKDQIIAINTLWDGIKQELSKVNTKALVPQDFIAFLNKYTENAVSLQGALSVGINSTEELSQIIPDPSTLLKLKTFLVTRPKTDYLIQQLDELRPLLPSVVDYTYLNRQPANTQKEFIDIMSVRYPNKILLEKALDEGSVSKIEKLLQAITPIRLRELLQISDQLNALHPRRARPNPPPQPTPKGALTTSGLSPADVRIVKAFEAEITALNTKFLDSLGGVDNAALVKN